MRKFFNQLRQFYASNLWPLPITWGVLSALLAWGLTETRLDSLGLLKKLWPGDLSSASAMLSLIASTSLTVLTMTISMTLIVLQVASGSFSHQLLRDYIQSPAVRTIVSVYVGVFTYSVVALRSLDKSNPNPPELSVTVAIAFILLALGTFVWYVSKVVEMVRVDSIINSVARRTIEYSQKIAAEPHCNSVAPVRPRVPENAYRYEAQSFGFLRELDFEALADWARTNQMRMVVYVRAGDRVMVGQTLARFWEVAPTDGVSGAPADDPTEGTSAPPPALTDPLADVFLLDSERVSGQDYTLGIRQLTDIAVRALSPGVNDPTTARHVIGQSVSALRELVQHPLPPRVIYSEPADEAGTARTLPASPAPAVPAKTPSSPAKSPAVPAKSLTPANNDRLLVWAASRSATEVVSEFVSQLRRYGAGEPGVLIDLLQLLEVVERASCDPDVTRMVKQQRDSIVQAAKREIADEYDLRKVLHKANHRQHPDNDLGELPVDRGI